MLARIRCIKIRRLSTLRLVTTCGSIILLRCCPLLCLHSCYAMHIFLYFSSLSPSIHSPAYTFTLDPPRVDIHSIFLTGSQGVASESLSDIFKSDVCEKETRESTRASKRARNQTMSSMTILMVFQSPTGVYVFTNVLQYRHGLNAHPSRDIRGTLVRSSGRAAASG